MPGIKSILLETNNPELSLFRGKAMECIGHVATAVGAELFTPDALEIMNLLIQSLVR